MPATAASPPPSPRTALAALARTGRSLRVTHPLPCTINGLIVAALALAAGAPLATVLVLASAMFAFQAAIGTCNDMIDFPRDRVTKPNRPLPAGDIDMRTAGAIGVAAAMLGLIVSAAFGLSVFLLGAAGLACGLAYDLRLRSAGLGWLCFALAFPILLLWTWLAAAGTLPPGWPLLLPLAALAGPTIHLANSLVDVESDVRVGAPSLAARLGRRRGLVALTLLSALLWLLAWAMLLSLPGASREALVLAAGATVVGWAGVAASWHRSQQVAEAGWLLQAVALGLLAVAWVMAAA